MEVIVKLNKKSYQYMKIGQEMLWVDEKQIIVPVMLHSILREKAILLGTDESIFLSKKETLKEVKVKSSIKQKRDKFLSDAINPFYKGK